MNRDRQLADLQAKLLAAESRYQSMHLEQRQLQSELEKMRSASISNLTGPSQISSSTAPATLVSSQSQRFYIHSAVSSIASNLQPVVLSRNQLEQQVHHQKQTTHLGVQIPPVDLPLSRSTSTSNGGEFETVALTPLKASTAAPNMQSLDENHDEQLGNSTIVNLFPADSSSQQQTPAAKISSSNSVPRLTPQQQQQRLQRRNVLSSLMSFLFPNWFQRNDDKSNREGFV